MNSEKYTLSSEEIDSMGDLTKENLIGFPSSDKPWLKYYSEDALNAAPPRFTMYRYIWENNKDYLSDIAFRYFGTTVTYGEFFGNVKQTVKAMVAMGISSGDMVTIMSMHTPETIYCIYALNYIGAVANLIYMTLSEKEILDAIESTNSKLLFALDPAVDRISNIIKRIDIPVVLLSVADSMPFTMAILYRIKNSVSVKGAMSYREFLKQGEGRELPAESTDHKSTAVIVYTSGSTGTPKGVMLSNDAINILAFQDMNGILPFERELTILFILPTFLGFGISNIHIILCAGFEVSLQLQLNPEIVAKALYKRVPNVFLTGPAFIDAIVAPQYENEDLSSLKVFIGGGGELPKEKEVEFNKYLYRHNSSAKYLCGYGMTETASALTTNCNEVNKFGSVGIPFFMVNVKVIDTNTGEELEYDNEGELHFSTPNMMIGYFKNEKATEEVLYKDSMGNTWIRSGDLGYVDRDGFVYVTGRIKRICFTRAKDGFSYKLFPQRIEEILQAESDIEKCGVITKEDEQRINVAVAFVTLKDKEMPQEIRETIRMRLFDVAARELPEHEQPADIIIIDTIPVTPSGKMDYQALKDKI